MNNIELPKEAMDALADGDTIAIPPDMIDGIWEQLYQQGH